MEHSLERFQESDLSAGCPKCGYLPDVPSAQQHKVQWFRERPNDVTTKNTLTITCGRCGAPIATRRALDSN
jgi:hypothetical protein